MRLLFLLLLFTVACAASAEVTVLRGSGGSIKTHLSQTVVLNKDSTLERQWIVINDSTLPLRFTDVQGAATVFRSRDYEYAVGIDLTADQDVVAFEVRFVVMDVFGQHQRTLSATYVQDVSADGRFREAGSWRLRSETDAATAFYSIGYVANVRTRDGRVLKANLQNVLTEARKISSAIKPEEIDREARGRLPGE